MPLAPSKDNNPAGPAGAAGGAVAVERVHRLAGDHLEHAYAAARITTHGAQCGALVFGEGDVAGKLLAGTASNCVGAFLVGCGVHARDCSCCSSRRSGCSSASRRLCKPYAFHPTIHNPFPPHITPQ